MDTATVNWPPPLWVPIAIGIFLIVGVYVFILYYRAWRTLRLFASGRGWQRVRKPSKDDFPAGFDALPSRRLAKPAFGYVSYVYMADDGIRIIKRSDWQKYTYGSYRNTYQGDAYVSFLVPIANSAAQCVVRYSFAARLYDFAKDVMHISVPGLAHPTWDCSSTEEQFPGAVICSGDLSNIDPAVTLRAGSMKRFAEICQSMEVTFEFVPGYLLISTAGAMAARIDRLYPVVLEMRG